MLVPRRHVPPVSRLKSKLRPQTRQTVELRILTYTHALACLTALMPLWLLPSLPQGYTHANVARVQAADEGVRLRYYSARPLELVLCGLSAAYDTDRVILAPGSGEEEAELRLTFEATFAQ